MSVTWQYHQDAKAAFERIAQIRGMEGDYDLVRGLIDAADPRPVVPIESLAPDQEKEWGEYKGKVPSKVKRIGRYYYAFVPMNTSPVGPFGTFGEAAEFMVAL